MMSIKMLICKRDKEIKRLRDREMGRFSPFSIFNPQSLISNLQSLTLIALIPLLLLLSPAALAQTGGDYDLSWNTIDSGGGSSSGGDYELNGVIGQPDAGAMTGANYELGGGFWGGGAVSGSPAGYKVFVPVVLKVTE